MMNCSGKGYCTITGKALKYGNNINTDIISPPQYMELGIEAGAPFAMSAIDADFSKKARQSPIMVAGENFGSGSSRETAPLMLKHLGVQIVVASFFARIFYRNAVNIGLLVVESRDVGRISEGDELELQVLEGKILNKTTGESLSCGKIPAHLLEIIQAGGLAPHIMKKRQESNA